VTRPADHERSSQNSSQSQGDITTMLVAVRDGGREERDALFACVYDRLRILARARLRRAAASSLDATGLVHEAYLRFADATRLDWQDRQHFFAAAAKAMRHIVVDHARRRLAAKRGAGGPQVPIEDWDRPTDARFDEVIAVDEALSRLADTSPRLVEVVELCFFAGLTTEEAGESLGLNARTVKREWQKAKLLLQALLRPLPRASTDAPDSP
jgi:RNA polymerase sigma factor (TIGR02999 family)